MVLASADDGVNDVAVDVEEALITTRITGLRAVAVSIAHRAMQVPGHVVLVVLAAVAPDREGDLAADVEDVLEGVEGLIAVEVSLARRHLYKSVTCDQDRSVRQVPILPGEPAE